MKISSFLSYHLQNKKRRRVLITFATPPSSAIIDKNNTYGDFLVVSFFQRTVNSKSPV